MKTHRSGPWPIIRRELRLEARTRSNFWLRILGAAGLTLFTGVLLKQNNILSADLSLRLFTGGHTLLLMAIWSIGPALASDAIGRERRDGTLGLLFSTSLTAHAIVVGKTGVHMVRLFTLWLATLPVLMVPILFGGVTALDVLSAILIEVSVALWALAAGLAVSSVVKHPTLALLTAELLAGALLLAFVAAVGLACALQLDPCFVGPAARSILPGTYTSPIAHLTGLHPEGGWSAMLRPVGALGETTWMLILAQILIASVLAFTVLTSFASARIRTGWMEKPLSARQVQRREVWFKPRFYLEWFKTWRRRGLDRNPLGWLHRHSTGARAASLGACAVVLFGEGIVAMSEAPWQHYERVQVWLAILLSLQMTCAAVKMFRTERDSGVLELLLVTPMRLDKVIYHQLCGFWWRFAPAVLMLILCSRLMLWLDWSSWEAFDLSKFLLINLLTAPILGLYASARFKNVVPGFVFAAFFTLGLPLLSPELGPGLLERTSNLDLWFLSQFPSPPNDSRVLSWFVRVVQLATAAWFCRLFYVQLSERTFIFTRPAN